MKVRIYQPTKNAMQSGRAKSQSWMIDPELPTARTPESLMGWAASGDTLGELTGKLKFASAAEAVKYATEKGWEYSITMPHERHIPPKNYLDNFKFIPAKDVKTGNPN